MDPIRKATAQDASRLAEILIFAKRKAYRAIFRNDMVSFRVMTVLPLALHYQNDAHALKQVYVYDDGIVKGMMGWNCEVKHEVWELKELYVDPFFQGEGIGTALLQNFLAAAQAKHIKAVFLWVLEENNAARTFYEANGFTATDEKREEYANTGKYNIRYKKIF